MKKWPAVVGGWWSMVNFKAARSVALMDAEIAIAEAFASDEDALRVSVPADDPSLAVIVEAYYVALEQDVSAGQPVCLLRSDRYVFELAAQTSGVVLEVFAEIGTQHSLDAPLLRIGAPRPMETEAVIPSIAPRATPLARRIAATHGLALDTLQLERIHERIRAADVRAALGISMPLPSESEPVVEVKAGFPSGPTTEFSSPRSIPLPASSIPRSTQIEVSARSAPVANSNAVPYALTAVESTIPALSPEHAVGRRMARRKLSLAYEARVTHAVAGALVEHRWLNSRWTDAGILLYGHITLGLDRGAGQTFVIEHAADLSLIGITHKLQTHLYADRPARYPVTFTIVRQPMSAWWMEPPPHGEAGATLTIGAPAPRPVVVETADGAVIAMRDRALLTLAYDGRYITQLQADAFLLAVRARIEQFAEM